MNNKKIFILNLTLLLILLWSIVFIYTKDETPVSLQPNWQTGSTLVTQVQPKITLQDAYKDLISKNNFPVSKSEFEMLWYYDNDIMTPQTQLSLKLGTKTFVYPSEREKLVDFFKNYYNKKEILTGLSHANIVWKRPEPKYIKDATKYFFFNKEKNYFFNLATFYNMSNVCGIIFDEQKSFLDVNSELISVPYAYNNAFELLQKWIEFHGKEFLLSETEYEKSVKEKFLKDEEITKLLYTLADKYVQTKDESYKKLFYEKFDAFLNKEFTYEEFSLFLELKKIDWETASYCDTFHNEYFLWK